ncbi:hypothetical protein B566_EDAN013450 [Ephemera danica]|nr:hypothetical protein B566_EDAN013450 [Ephemera danica]
MMDRYAKACRICLKEDGISVPIFGEEGRYRMVAEKIRDCLNIPAYHNDPLPKKICNRCFYKLDVASELKVLSQRSSAIFVQILSTLKNSSTAAEFIRRIQERPNTQVPSQATALGQKRKLLEPRKPGENADTPGPAKKRPPIESPINRNTPNHENFGTSCSQGADTQESFPCEVCEKVFPTQKMLLNHVDCNPRGVDTGGNAFEYACNICDRTFERAKSLKMHSIKYHKIRLTDASPHRQIQKPVVTEWLPKIKTEHMTEAPVECNTCFQMFDNEHDLEDHINNDHSDMQSVAMDDEAGSVAKPECVYCFQTLKNNCGLVNHLRTAHGKPSCIICLEIFSTQEELLEHRGRVHKGTEPQPSVSPPLSLKTNDESVVMESPQEYPCKLCGKTFERETSLFRHKAYHTKMGHTSFEYVLEEPEPTPPPPTTFTCEKCGKTFDKHISFVRHKAYHSKMGPNWVPSEVIAAKQAAILASESGSGNEDGEAHQAQHEPESDEDFRDSSSSGVSVTQSVKTFTKRQLQKNTGFAPYCLYCKKIYADYRKLWDHVRKIHPSKERYKCPRDSRVFFSKTGYRNHLTAHKNKEGPSGNAGNKAESTSSASSTPTTGTPVPPGKGGSTTCEICRKQFSSKASLHRHNMEIHTLNAPTYKCNLCPRVFIRKELLAQHKELHVRLGKSYVAKEEPSTAKPPTKSRVLVYPRALCRYCPKVLSKKYLPDHEKIHRRAGHKPLVRNTAMKNVVSNENPNTSVSVQTVASPKQQPLESFKKKKPLCKYCSATPATFEDLRHHLDQRHAGKEYFPCVSCPEVYYDAVALKSHSNCHFRSYTACKHCKRPFAYKQKLINHEKFCMHRKAPPPAPVKPTTPATSAPMLQPKTESSSTPIYTCDFCGSQFLETQSFVKHLQGHANR